MRRKRRLYNASLKLRDGGHSRGVYLYELSKEEAKRRYAKIFNVLAIDVDVMVCNEDLPSLRQLKEDIGSIVVQMSTSYNALEAALCKR